MIQDHYYKFQDRQTMLDALQPLGMTYEDSEGNQQVSQGGHQYAAWFDVPGYEGLYQVTNDGRARSLDRQNRKGKILKPQIDKSRYGHVSYSFFKDGKSRKWGAHQLVMLTFVGPCPIGMEVRHLNGIPGDNRLENLKYGTSKENAHDAKIHGTRQIGYKKLSACLKQKYVNGLHTVKNGEDNHLSKLTEHDVYQIRKLRSEGAALKAIGLLFDLNHKHVWKIVHRKSWAHI